LLSRKVNPPALSMTASGSVCVSGAWTTGAVRRRTVIATRMANATAATAMITRARRCHLMLNRGLQGGRNE
jgi:hypothetical protein